MSLLASLRLKKFAIPLAAEFLGQGRGVRVGKLGLRHSHGFSFVFDLGRYPPDTNSRTSPHVEPN